MPLPRFLPLALALLLPCAAAAQVLHIPGPQGPLEGAALVPPGAAHAVILVPGSGPTDRDGNGPQVGLASDSYRLLAEGLAEGGVASIRIDKRGFFGSTAAIADPNDVTIGAYAQDLRGWVARARQLAPCVWIAGHSEGGLVALVAAQEAPEGLCGLILLAAPGRPLGDILVNQFEANPASAPLAPLVRTLVDELAAGRTRDPASLPPALQWLFAAGHQRFMIDLLSHDPAGIAAQLDLPVLIVQGDADLQILPRDADLLQQALPQARRLDLPGATHMLKADVPGDPTATYRDPSLPLHPDLVPGILQMLKGRP